ncbi:hypothetical protein K491DRAFT_632445 [Lophiostoma macrostomum CBS 122681]|uniref:Uncharacterized protein n=1 Tax=Lophiostoma macrostomum CBS 122681 TaxID=1314788 RepID=A0A6A6T5T3_9PLEO|nr:hypothetical protein K491DRAFT_632445 [Lophiostoma macrostomum CBS 122681]
MGAMVTCRRRVLGVSVAAVVLIALLYFNLHQLDFSGLRTFLDESNLDEHPRFGPQHHGQNSSVTNTATSSQPTTTSAPPVQTPSTTPPDKVIVIASTQSDDTSWIGENFPDWQHAIYVVDNQSAPLHTEINKGNEANVYLTYLIANYDNLPSTIVFSHDHRTHHHGSRSPPNIRGSSSTNDIAFDNVATIKALRIPYVQQTGYANLRCIQHPGCPAGLRPLRTPSLFSPMSPQERAMPAAWFELFGNHDVPEVLAAACCAQFAVSRDAVRKRGKAEYERFLWWLLDTPLDDYTSGRIFEFLWHVVFGMGAVHCPDEGVCYREQFGVGV